jgi:ribosome-associated protein YbcJ (S4-like RNA binding protein)
VEKHTVETRRGKAVVEKHTVELGGVRFSVR